MKNKWTVEKPTRVVLRKDDGSESPYTGLLLPGRQNVAQNQVSLATMGEIANLLHSEGYRIRYETLSEDA
jgi:hypothetical protein